MLGTKVSGSTVRNGSRILPTSNVHLAVEITEGILRMRSRNRSWISHAKKTVLEGKSFPRRLDADIAAEATVVCTSKLLLLVREFLLLDGEIISRKSFSDID